MYFLVFEKINALSGGLEHVPLGLRGASVSQEIRRRQVFYNCHAATSILRGKDVFMEPLQGRAYGRQCCL